MSDSTSNSQLNQEHCDGVISVGPWGGPGGGHWSFKPKNGITKIEILYESAICARFHSYGEASNAFGSKIKEATKIEKICIEYPSEYLTGITGTYYNWCNWPSALTFPVIKSLCIYTNTSKYGIYGSDSGTPFSFRIEGGEIVGFHGKSGSVLDNIGVYVKPKICSICKPSFLVYQEKKEERELNSARLQVAAHQVTITTLQTKVNQLMKIIIVSSTGLVFWFILMKMLPYIWSFSILVTMLGVKMVNKVVSDAVDGWVLNLSVYICTYLISKIYWS